MKVSIAVPGKFHYFNYVEELEKAGLLESFIYSHKIGKGRFRNSLHHNIYLKEYLLQAHSKFFGHNCSDTMFPLYHELWARLATFSVGRPDILHVPLHGAALSLIKNLKPGGTKILGEALNTHPNSRNPLLENEDRQLFGRVRYPQTRMWKRQEAELLLTDYILTPSASVKLSYVNNAYDESRVFVLPYSGNPSSFPSKQNYKFEGPLKLLVVAGVTPRKGHHKLLEALKMCKLRIKALFAGAIDYEYAEVLKKTWGDVDFELLGKIKHHHLKTLMQECDIFCLPSLEEGLAISICEGLSSGLPVIATNQSGAGELVTHGVNGFLYESHDIAHLGVLISELANKPNLREQLGQAAAASIINKHNWEHYALELAQIYKKIFHS